MVLTRLFGPCGYGPGPCGASPTRPFPDGARCAAHTPWALRGEPEPAPGPGYTPQKTPTPASAGWRAIDARHIATGKRRSSPQDLAAARAALTEGHHP